MNLYFIISLESFARLGRRILSIIAILLVLTPNKTYAQYDLNLNIDVDKLADATWAPVFKDLVEGNLYARNYKSVYEICYREIYKNSSGRPTPIAYYYMGACLELGMGTNEVSQYKAKAHYEKGAALGNKECKARLKEINSSGYRNATNANREAFAKKYGRFNQYSTSSGSGAGSGSGNVRSTPNSNNSTTCSGCHGSGRCSYCGGDGKVLVDGGLYVSYDHYVYKNCDVCHGSGRCGVCYGSGKINY
ncbi:MAG: hypothetical protein PUD39_05525 [Bacteroidales bacterium]|nr:hypothetical protein [Bacteroidales bacterium]